MHPSIPPLDPPLATWHYYSVWFYLQRLSIYSEIMKNAYSDQNGGHTMGELYLLWPYGIWPHMATTTQLGLSFYNGPGLFMAGCTGALSELVTSHFITVNYNARSRIINVLLINACIA